MELWHDEYGIRMQKSVGLEFSGSTSGSHGNRCRARVRRRRTLEKAGGGAGEADPGRIQARTPRGGTGRRAPESVDGAARGGDGRRARGHGAAGLASGLGGAL